MNESSGSWPDRILALLHENGLRATPARIAVLHLLQLASRPLSHAEVVDRLADRGWNRATLYRNLVDLAETGLARKTELGDRVWRFEVAGAAHSSRSHPHFICTGCGEVSCLDGVAIKLAAESDESRDLMSQPLEIQVRGICAACRERGEDVE